MKPVNSHISASHQPVTGTNNLIGPCRSEPTRHNEPSRRHRPARKPRADRRVDLNQRNASRKSRNRRSGLYTDAPPGNTSVLEFSIDGLYPNDDFTYPPPPNFSHYQLSTQELPADVVSPRARDLNHHRLSSIEEDESLFPLQEGDKRENHERTSHVLPDERGHSIHTKEPREEPSIQDRRAAKNVSYNNERGRFSLYQISILPSPPASRDPSLSTVHDAVEQSTDELEILRAKTVLKGSETRRQVVKALSDMQGGHILVDIDGEPSRERDVIVPVPQRSKSPFAIPLGQIIPKTKSPVPNMKSNKSSGGVPVSRTSKSIGGPWINQKYQMFSNFDMWP
ncbi:hypothetical protein GGI35DRAFT_425007 [Trichoderma velutinum]